MYINCHSFYSLKYGTLPVEKLVEEAVARGIKTLVLTDINLISGVFDFVKECIKAKIKPVVGVEFRNGDEFKYICIARNLKGYSEINAFLSEYLRAEKPFTLQPPSFENVFVIYSPEIMEYAIELKTYEYIGIKHWELANLSYKYQDKLNTEKCVVWQPVTFLQKNPGFHLHRLLRAIDHNVLISKLPVEAHATPHELFPDPASLAANFKICPEMIENTKGLLEQCSFDFKTETPKNKKVFSSSAKEDGEMLNRMALEGAEKRFGQDNEEALARIKKELSIIKEMGFEPYFLITWDIIRFARSQGFHHVGRGSGANSVVAYCIEITDVNPIKLDLYFERFINLDRTSPPDFDIDFSWDERDVIYNYIFDKYGADHVCLMGTCSTFRGRSIYRELGKVFGMPKAEIEELVNNPSGIYPNGHIKHILQYGELMEDFPAQLSIHAGGVLISEETLYHYTALQPMPKGFPICQFDMYMAEDVGFAKFDILSQRGLGHIKSAVDIIKENRGEDVDVHAIEQFMEDPEIKRHMREHETMGAFYVESPAMRQLMWKLGCDNYLTLVAASSIIRPGVSASGMMQHYINYHHHPEQVVYAHEIMKELMSETYGVMVYQEDVIKVAHYFAGLTLREADMLRRAMSGKYRSRMEFDKIVDRWYENCKKRGYSYELAKEVWRQIESFSGYSFSKAHSASYAVESYQSLFLKAHYPLEFMVAVINNFGGFYNTEMYIHEARRYGGLIQAPDLNQSRNLTCIRETTIWLGWIHVEGLERKVIEKIEGCKEERRFSGFGDFLDRVETGLEQLIILIRVGSFRSFNRCKKELLWQANFHHHRRARVTTGPSLFGNTRSDYTQLSLPKFETMPLEDVYDEIEYLGFPLSSPFKMIDEKPLSGLSAVDLPAMNGQVVSIYGYMVTVKSITTRTNKKMAFGYFIDYKGEYFDTTHFPQIVDKYPLRGKGSYFIVGKVIVEYGFPSIEVMEMRKVNVKPDPRTVAEVKTEEGNKLQVTPELRKIAI